MYTYENLTENIHNDWLPFFEENKDHLMGIINILNKMTLKIYPNYIDIFRALYYHGPKDIKLLLLGQDPYISEENNIPQAMGLSFSVPPSHKKIPPSLKNIFKEIKNNYPDFTFENGSLERWAKEEKILLLNSSLTVFNGSSNSHSHLWPGFTDKLIKWFNEQNNNCVFLLMGNYAKNKSKYITNKIFSTVHPSPLSAHKGFFGCGVFKNINDYLDEHNIIPIKW
jgi:uracil-DNA glycosylase